METERYLYFALFLAFVAVLGLMLEPAKRLGWWMVMACAVLLLMFSGCASIDRERMPPADWPQLNIVVNRVNFFQMQEKCQISTAALVLFGHHCYGLAEADFCTKTCTVTIAAESWLDHEKAHCVGYDHPGASTMSDAWETYKQTHGNHHCRFRLGQERYCKLHNDSEICAH